MNNFKSGAGDLDFGGDESDDGVDGDGAEPGTGQEHADTPEEPASVREADHSATTDSIPEQQNSEQGPLGPAGSSTSANDYPYFVRRSNVGDERDTRLEIHVRDRVADREAEFRSELAERLGASEVSKTDAREFALLAAFRDPDRVANLMREEGFGALD